ncbi:MAG: GntR family transcriptional regulator [Defluviitaleaceae bacterium]|nr:GntR family transcriptional regulator [Defluviitaleaceae bacterium]
MTLEKIDDYNLLSNRVYESIKNAINNNNLKAGEKVTETKLSKALGVSRTPVREALRILHSEGYVQLTPNSSFIVNQFDVQDVREILIVRGALEGEAARLAARFITPEQEQQLLQIHECISSVSTLVCNEGEAYEFYLADVSFHDKIIEIACNKQITAISRSLRDRMYRMRIAIGKMPNSVRICGMQHMDIIKAILAHDEEAAAVLSRFHTNYIAETVLPLCIDSM